MAKELTQIETLTLRDYIDKEMTQLRHKALDELSKPTEQMVENIAETMSKTSKLIILQEIAYRLEYGYITEIGSTSLKHHLEHYLV